MAEITTQVAPTIEALTQEFNIITHNLANVSTVGYKRRSNAFSQYLKTRQGGEDTYSPGTIDLNSSFDFSQGSVVETGRPLDFALFGKGFFVIETPEGPLYTRNGVFLTNQNGQISDVQGRIVAGEGGPITIPLGAGLSQINVSDNGAISAAGTTIGKFRLVDFGENESTLVPTGANCFIMPDESIIPDTAENIVVKQGYQESSNVKIIDELVDMIMVARLYEANMKFVSASNETSSSIIGVAMG
jgi:flagellar basal body rod protein FlgG